MKSYHKLSYNYEGFHSTFSGNPTAEQQYWGNVGSVFPQRTNTNKVSKIGIITIKVGYKHTDPTAGIEMPHEVMCHEQCSHVLTGETQTHVCQMSDTRSSQL